VSAPAREQSGCAVTRGSIGCISSPDPTPNKRLGVLDHCKCLPGLMSLIVYGIGSSSLRPPSPQCPANGSAGPTPFSRSAHGVRNGITSASHAEGPWFKSRCVHFVIHMPPSTRVARELRARIPAALSCRSPLTQSLQPNVWHNDLVHIVAQALATTILKCMV
jgi:hypothetical protein